MDVAALVKEVKSGNLKPVYFLMGDEPYFMDQFTNFVEHQYLPEEEKAFNQTVVYGKETSLDQIAMEAKQFPTMAEHRVVLVKEAQNIKAWDALESYLKNPNPSTLFVIAHKYKSLDKRKSAYKALKKADSIIESNVIKDHQLPVWIKRQVGTFGLQIGDRETQLLAEHIGNNLSLVAKELEKLKTALGAGASITATDIEKHVGISKEYNIFELQNALGDGNFKRAVKITRFFADHPKENPFPVILAFLYGFFSKVIALQYLKDKSDSNVASKLKVPPFAVKNYKQAARVFNGRKVLQIISLLREYDLRSKGVNNKSTEHSELLVELILKIIS